MILLHCGNYWCRSDEWVTNGRGGIKLRRLLCPPKADIRWQRSELPLGIDLNRQRELRSLIPHISHALIDWPNLQVRVIAWLEHRQ